MEDGCNALVIEQQVGRCHYKKAEVGCHALVMEQQAVKCYYKKVEVVMPLL